MSGGSPPPPGRRITVSSVSCRGVKSFVPFQKPPLYAAVSLGGRREKTPIDPDGGENPDWDGADFAFDLDGGVGKGDDGLLQFEVKAQVPLLGPKLVGKICVPVSHLGGGGGDGAVPQRVSYQVLGPDGRPNGSLSFVHAVTGGGAYQQPQIYAAPFNGARPEQDLSSCCASPPPPPSSSAYPPPAMPNSAQPGSCYPPPAVSTSLYPPLQDMLLRSNYTPPPRMMESLFPASNSGLNSSYTPPAVGTTYPPPPAACAAYSVPSTKPISNYPPSSYPPPPPSGYPSPQMNPEFPAPASIYPPPAPESVSLYSALPRSMDRELPYMAPSFQDSVVTYPELPGSRVPSGGSYYPPSGMRHHEDGASSPYYYPHPGPRYSYG